MEIINMNTALTRIIASFACASFVACGGVAPTDTTAAHDSGLQVQVEPSIVDSIATMGKDSRYFRDLMKQAGILDLLDNPRFQVTVFVPHRSALEAYMERRPWLAKPGNEDELSEFLLGHFVPGRIEQSALRGADLDTLVDDAGLAIVDPQVRLGSRGGRTANIHGLAASAFSGNVFTIDDVLPPHADLTTTLRARRPLFAAAFEVAYPRGLTREVTVLMPDDQALLDARLDLAAIQSGRVDGQVVDFVRRHTIDGRITLDDLENRKLFTLAGAPVRAEGTKHGPMLRVGREYKARLLDTDLHRDDGAIHELTGAL